MTALPEVRLVCPKCKSRRLRSDEVATIGYPVALTRNAAGQIEVDYTGEDREVFDEGTTYCGDLWCRDCGHNFAPHELLVDGDDEEE